MRSLQQFLGRIFFLVQSYVFGLLLLNIYRFLYMRHVLSEEEVSKYNADISQAFLTGLRFDTVTLCYALLLPLLFSLIALLVRSHRLQSFADSFIKYFTVVVITLFTILLVVDYYYYNYFQSHFNVLLFGLWRDDTGNVMRSVYSDYPFIRIILFFAIFYVFCRWFIGFLYRRRPQFETLSFPMLIFLSVFITGLFAIGLRGSFGTFPVQVDDANVSANDKVNLLPVNGIFALKTVMSMGFMQNELVKFDGEIKRMGYESRGKAWGEYFGQLNSEDTLSAFFTHTRKDTFLDANPPNVIFFLMESMSNNNLFLQSERINVTGALQKYIDSGNVFRKFLPAQNGTINTLEALMINTPMTSLAQSEYGADTFPTASAKPFYEKGYATTFVTGGKINWRNLSTFVPRQYFSVIEGDADIREQNPSTQECEWGVYDEYLFDHVFKKLESGKPQFIFALSTTNHTPFHLPENYKPLPVSLNDSIKALLQVDEQRALNNLRNFQYSNDCLGRFIDRVRNSPYAGNTIIFATGDHNNLMLFNFSPSQLYYKLSVPLVTYVPEKYMQHALLDTSRWGSHKDIFPTLYNLSLSNATYFNGGNDLFSTSLPRENFFGEDLMSWVAMDDHGVVRFDSKEEIYSWTVPYLLERKESSAGKDLIKKARSRFGAEYHFFKTIMSRH